MMKANITMIRINDLNYGLKDVEELAKKATEIIFHQLKYLIQVNVVVEAKHLEKIEKATTHVQHVQLRQQLTTGIMAAKRVGS